MATLEFNLPDEAQPVSVDLSKTDAGWTATCRDKTVDVQHVANDEQQTLLINNQSYAMQACQIGSRWQVWLNGKTYVLDPVDRSPQRQTGANAAAGSGEIKAPMPGSVLQIQVTEGDTVAADQPLVIMESMKMEMTLSAPAAGTVAAVLCTVGEMVEQGAVLIQLDHESEDQ